VPSILVAAVALLAAVPAFASPIVYQHTAPSAVVSTRASQDQTGGSGIEFQTWDSFFLTTTTLIDAVDWQGSYFNSDPLYDQSQAPLANSTGFVVQFFDDSAGTPGSLLASQQFSPAGASQTFNSQQVFGVLNLSVYDYAASLSSGFLANGGTTYWLSVYALSPVASSTEAQWGWNGGLGGNGFSYQAGTAPTAPPPGQNQVNFDRAFALHGNPAPIPEPATMLLFGSGLAGIAARARARRRNRK
jgi:hypothetical protein